MHAAGYKSKARVQLQCIECFLWTIKHTNGSLDNSKQHFTHHGLHQACKYVFVCMPDEARDGRNVALNYQVNRWCAQLSKGTILYYQLSVPNNFHNSTATMYACVYRVVPIYLLAQHTSHPHLHYLRRSLKSKMLLTFKTS